MPPLSLRRAARFVLAAVFLLLAPLRLAAQAAAVGTIEGRVAHSAAGSYLKQVRVTVDGTTLETLTDEAGEFRLAAVPAGEVTLRAAATGFAAQTARVAVTAGRTARRDFDLGPRDAAAAPSAAAGRDQTIVLDAFTVAERDQDI
jgi:hypothetical protein